MAAYAKSNQFPADISVVAIERKGSLFRMPTYDVDVVIGKSRALQFELQVKQPIWSPDLYQELTAKLINGIRMGPGSSSSNDVSLFASFDLRDRGSIWSRI